MLGAGEVEGEGAKGFGMENEANKDAGPSSGGTENEGEAKENEGEANGVDENMDVGRNEVE